MQNNGTSVLDRPEVSQLSPVIGRSTWIGPVDLEAEPEAAACTVTLRLELPLSPRWMVAALWHDVAEDDASTTELDIADDAGLWNQVALIVAEVGWPMVQDWAFDLDRMPARQVKRPEWLAFVQRRVAEVTGGAR
jgi:hypothetical protein